jgi:hypothetical protein
VDVLNHLHERLFAAGSGEDGAAAAEAIRHEPMRAAARFTSGEGPDVEIAVVEAGDARADDARALEAAWIASYVRDLVAARVPRTRL